MKSPSLLSAVIILALSSLACFSLSTLRSSSNILFQDDFSDTDKKWDQVTEPDRSTGYYDNAYRITVNTADSHVWANPRAEDFTDVRIEVDATKNGGPDDNDFGIICRYTGENQFYYGVISSDGYYGIYKVTSDGAVSLGNESMLQSDAISLGQAKNHLRFDCKGSTLSLYVNGTLVDEQTDPDFSTGNVGLMAGTFQTEGTDILFDNFIVAVP